MSDRPPEPLPTDPSSASVATATQKLRSNEAIKLTATWLNGVATAVVAAGTFTPLFALLYGLSVPHIGVRYLLVISGLCLLLGIGLHVLGRTLLNGLQP